MPEHAARYCGPCGDELTSAELDDPNEHYVQVVSWVTGPKLQGPVLRTQTGFLAHKRCIEKILNGQAVDQEPIPGMEGL